jgi:hypothetical protein
MISGIFLKEPFLDYNYVGQKTLFLYFSLLGTFANSEEPEIFSMQVFYRKGTPRELGPHLEG